MSPRAEYFAILATLVSSEGEYRSVTEITEAAYRIWAAGNRVCKDVEAPPRVIAEIEKLEQQLADCYAALKEIQAIAESSVKTHGYDKAHIRVADIAKRALP